MAKILNDNPDNFSE